jgi:serine/threonine-protein kinase
MPQVETQTGICTSCGALTDASLFGDELTCMACLLRLGFAATKRRDDDDWLGASVPDHIGPYAIARQENGSLWQLGRGAMGITFRAIDESLQRPVALKIINSKLGSRSAEARERFTREARAAAALRHPNVATVYQFGVREETGQFFYAMELVEGETLEERVRRLGPLDVPTTIDIALQVTNALEAAEERGLVHRDLKPGNLMLVGSKDNRAPAVKVIDFGVAKAISEKTNAMALTHGGFVGTPAFASPEQFTNSPVDVRSDIYSLGVTLWFALTGHMLFSGRSVEEIRQAHRSSELPVEQLKVAGVPRRFISLLTSVLAIEPAARPAGARELAAKLQAIRASITSRRKVAARFALAGAVVALTTIVAIRLFHSTLSTPTAPPIPEKSIAVLPFANLSREPENAYFADGIQAQIAARLAKVANLKVVSGSSTRRYPTTPKNPAQVAAELGVADVLEGSVEKAGEKFRIAVRLIDPKNNVALWAQSYDRMFMDILQVESEVAGQAAGALGVKLTEPQKRAIDKTVTSNPRAYDAYLRGRYVWLQRNYDSFQQAKEYFEQAIALDPNYAKAHAGLADAYQFLAAYDQRGRKENYENARRACQRALELEPTLAEAHASAGLVAMNYEWDWALAEQELRRGIALDPNNGLYYDWYAEYLMAVGRTDESLANMERARELDPFSMIINCDLGKLLYFARLYDEAEAQLKETLRMYPDLTSAHCWLGLTYVMKHRFEDAIAEFSTPERTATGTWHWGWRAYAYGMAGRKTEAEQVLEEIKKRLTRGADAAIRQAYIGLGDKDQAMACLEREYENHDTAMTSLKSDPIYDSLRSDPRFVALMRRVHLVP